MTLRIGEQDIIADREEAKRQWKLHEQEASRWKEIYIAYESLARLTGSQAAAGSSAVENSTVESSNGQKPDAAIAPTVRDLVLQVVKENRGSTAQDIRAKVITLRSSVKDQYIYNLLTELTKRDILDRRDGKYYMKAGK